MKKTFTRKLVFFALTLASTFLHIGKLKAQSITFDNVPPFGTGSTAVGSGGGIVFNFTTNKSIILENFRVASTATTVYTATIWYNPTKIFGQPVIANMNAAGGWISLGSSSHAGAGNAALATIPISLNLRMNPGDTFGFFIQFSGGNVFSTSTLVTPTFSNGTVTIIADNDCAFTRNATTWFGPVRQLNGGIIYRLAEKGANDASISGLVSPVKFCGTTQNVSVKLSNMGKNIINNVDVNWTLDGVPQPTISVTNPLDTIGHPTKISDTVLSLGSISYLPNQIRNIIIWSSAPNGVTDTITKNDTLRLTFRPGLSGTYAIGSTASDFTSFKTALNAIDSFGKCGPLVFNVTAGETFNTTSLSISNLDSITFQKFGVGANPIVYGLTGVGTTDAIFKIAGSKAIVFDGIDVADHVSNTTTTTQMEYGYAVMNAGGTNGSSNNTIKNCNITMNRTNTASFGILQSASTTGGAVAATALSGGNHNNRYENVKISNVYKGIGLIGTPGFPDSNCVITSTGGDTTIIGANVANDIGNGTVLVYGISAADEKNVEISKCWVRNLAIAGSSTVAMQGIFIDNGSTTTNYGTARVWGNTVYNVGRVSTSATVSTATHVHGIRIDASTTAAAQVWNNVVYNITSVAATAAVSANQMVRAISFGSTTGTGTADFYHNSVSINNSALNSSSAAFWKGGTGVVTVRNNIFSNTAPAQTGVAKHYASYINAGSFIASNNIYYAPNANGFVGFATSDRATLAQFAAATSTAAPSNGNDQGSANANPNFSSATSLDFTGATPAANSGTPVTTPLAITTDILGTLRSVTTPSVGAYETIQPLFDSAAPVITNVTSFNSATPYVYATVTDNSATVVAGSIQLWYRLGSSGAFSGIAPDSVPVGSLNGTYKWGASLAALPAGSYQYYIAVRDLSGSGLNISVNPIQASTFTNFAPGDPVNYALNPDPAVNTRTFMKLNTLAAGTYTIGPSGTYLKLTDAAAALNNSELSGNITFEFQAGYDGTTGETFPITFNQFGTLGGNWTVTIRPASGASALQVRGSNTTSIIDLNGAKRIRFDGRPGGTGTTNQLSFTNTANSGSVFRFINDAQNDTLRYINIADSNTSATSGNIFFSTTNAGTAATNGNSNNLIDNCSINGLSNTVNCIYSSGTAAPADNKNNTITNCNIFDFFSNTVSAVNGILLEAGNSSWNIGTPSNGNKFYQTAVRNSTTVPALTIAVGFRAIQINSATVNGCNIVDNRIGGNIPGIPSSTFVIGDNVGATAYVSSYIRAIDIVAAGTTTPVSIQGNTISDITLYTAITAGFGGIHALGGWVNTGNITGNTIGAATGTGSINLYYKNTSTGINLYGIRYSGPTTGLIQNNVLGSISADAAAGSMQLLVVYLSGTYTSAITVSNNTIGSLTTAHSIQSLSSSLAPVNIMGIVTSAATGAAITINNNTVMNLSSLCTLAATTNGLKGIYITGASSVGTTISGNIIRKLYSESTNPATDQTSAIVGINTASSGAGPQIISGNTVSALVSGALSGAVNVMGIYYGSTTTGTPNRIERNLIHSVYASASNGSALVSGITQGAGAARLIIANNMIRLGFDSTGLAATGPHFITGIQKSAGSINTTIFNSVNIGGTGVASGVSNSYAYRSIGVGVDSLLNNIFVNTRSNATTGGIHYAIGLGATTTLTINRNLYNTTGALGQFNAIDQAALTDWRIATSQDAQSVSTAVNFVSNTDLHLTGASLGNTLLVGVPIAGITTDFDGQTRHAGFPYMGADESLTFPLPVTLIHFAANATGKNNVKLNWATATEKNSRHFEVERSIDGKNFEYVGMTNAAGNSIAVHTYSFNDESAPLETNNTVYYRLKMVDRDGQAEYSNIVSVGSSDNEMTADLQAYPNPFNESVTVLFEGASANQMDIVIKDITGKTMHTFTQTATVGMNVVTIENLKSLPAGFYFMTVNIDNRLQTIKLIKD